MEVGCLRHPGASTIGNHHLDEDHFFGWQILATQPWAPTQEEQTPCWNSGKREGKAGGRWAGRWAVTLQNRQKNASCTYATLRPTSTRNSNTCAYVSIPLSTRGTQALFVVPLHCLWLHFYKNYLTPDSQTKHCIIRLISCECKRWKCELVFAEATSQFYVFWV